jgi:hypothetical protein
MRRKSHEKTESELEAVGYMPDRFVSGYLELVRVGMQTGPSNQTYDNETKQAKKPYREHAGGLKDEKALRFKAWVDRQLRAIGRDVQAYLNVRDGTGPSPINVPPGTRREIARELERKTELKCPSGSCGKYISWQWTHCAWCGHRIVKTSDVTMNVTNDTTPTS